MKTDLLPRELRPSFTAIFMLAMVAKTLMMQNIPNVIPRRDKKVRSLFDLSSSSAILKLETMIFRKRNMTQNYKFPQDFLCIYADWLNPDITGKRISTSMEQCLLNPERSLCL